MTCLHYMCTAALILIGVGTSANIQLKTAKAFGTGYLMSTLGWATAVLIVALLKLADTPADLGPLYSALVGAALGAGILAIS